MKVMVTGSRGIITDMEKYIPQNATLIISGGASGVDRCAEIYADKNNIPKVILRPEYKKYGRLAPLKRNKEMVDMADIVIAVWDGKSRGTKNAIDYAISIDKELKIYNVL